MKLVPCALVLVSLSLAGCVASPDSAPRTAAVEPAAQGGVAERVAHYARVYDVPESLIHRAIARESGYNPAAHSGPYWGLMQIRLDTARGMGYRGPARGLLDADTNLKYAVAYLSNAWLVAGGDQRRALGLYAGGYFYEARRKGLLDRLRTAPPD
jgi:soluble lytic murein transglycosylase-like protein